MFTPFVFISFARKSPLHLGVLFLAGLGMLSCENGKDRIKASYRPLTESVYASVTIQPEGRYEVFAAAPGILERTFVEEGDTVGKGMALFQITNQRAQLSTENARLSRDLARDKWMGEGNMLEELEAEVAAARLRFRNDSLNFVRQQSLWQQGVGTRAEYDARELAFEVAQKNLSALEQRYARTREELETQYRQAQNNYRRTLVDSEDFTVNSLMEGKVYDILKNPGEQVNTQQPLAVVGRADSFVIEMQIDEVDIVRLQVGQQVLITLDAYGDQVFEARIFKIYPLKDTRTQTFTVEGGFTSPPPRLYPGLSGEANILVAQKARTLTIPVAYLGAGEQLKTDEGWVKVETGLKNMDHIEILGGVDTTTYLYLPE